MTQDEFRRAVLDHLFFTRAKSLSTATALDFYHALAQSVRDRLIHRWLATQATYHQRGVKRVCYMSSEFLTGRSLGLCLVNLGLYDTAQDILATQGIDLGDVLEHEGDPGLGNGGLGRLAACIMDSLATLELPAIGYGIRYDFGIFEQLIRDGYQIERHDNWLQSGNPWEVPRHELSQTVGFGGHTEYQHDENGRLHVVWVPEHFVVGLPHDSFIVGHHTNNVNTLRLWSARATMELNLEAFNAGDYLNAVAEQAASESISKVLYPNDSNEAGKRLRLKQQYFFVACSLADIFRRHQLEHPDLTTLTERVAIQLNDTHPAIAVAELMRLLIDIHGNSWEQAWEVTQRCIAYTNHTLLPEALECWSADMFKALLPRHWEIICEINRRFLREVHVKWRGDAQRIDRMTIVTGPPFAQVRMAHLACVASSSINGVAELHTQLLKHELLHDFYELWPQKFNNKTNGVSPRRWLLHANPGLTNLLYRHIGESWSERRFSEISQLAQLSGSERVLDELNRVKLENKESLCKIVKHTLGVQMNPHSMFIVQAKRFHEYKRQLLAVLQVMAEYLALRDDPTREFVPRTYIFSGKAASSYHAAKLHIKLVHDVASIVNTDPIVAGRLQVVFLPNYGVTWAERIIPAADLSVQISLAGREASGTGNMKFAMNGALTIGTLDGANVEIRDQVGAENFFLFGMTVEEVTDLKNAGYVPQAFVQRSEQLEGVMEALRTGLFSPDDPGRYHGLVHALCYHDPYMVCGDFDSYCEAHAEVDQVFANRREWAKRCIHNIAGTSRFTSDETVSGYAREIWELEPSPVSMDQLDGLEGAPDASHTQTFRSVAS